MNILEYAKLKKMLGGKGSGGGTVGTWVLNEVLTSAIDVIDTQAKFDEWENDGYYHELVGYVKSTNGNELPIDSFRCTLINGTFYGEEYDNVIVVHEANDILGYWGEEGWFTGRTLTITKEPSTAVANWIKANGKKQAEPLVYHLTSVDELPTNAVDGSLAVVEHSDSAIGKWELHGYDDMPVPESNIEMVFTCDGAVYALIEVGSHQDFFYSREVEDFTDPVFSTTDGWYGDWYTTIEVFTEPSDEGKAWLKQVGNKVTNLTTLYARENGEWVEKGAI